LEKALAERGVTATRAKSIVASFPADRIERQIEHVDFIRAKHPSEIRSLAGFLRKAIEENYAAPPGFVSKAELSRRDELVQEKSRVHAEERRRRTELEAREQSDQARIAAHLDTLSMEQLEELDGEILADPKTRESYERQFPKWKKLYLELLRKDWVRAKLGLPAQA
jgi:hypothetical protein